MPFVMFGLASVAVLGKIVYSYYTDPERKKKIVVDKIQKVNNNITLSKTRVSLQKAEEKLNKQEERENDRSSRNED